MRLQELAEDIDIEIENVVEGVALAQFLLRYNLRQREAWENTIFDLFANRASKLSVAKSIDLPLFIVVSESDLLEMVLS